MRSAVSQPRDSEEEGRAAQCRYKASQNVHFYVLPWGSRMLANRSDWIGKVLRFHRAFLVEVELHVVCLDGEKYMAD